MSDNRLLLIGESPSKAGTPDDQALAGRIGKRLAELLGVPLTIYLEGFARVNLLPDFIGKRPGVAAAPWPAQEASEAADQLIQSGLLSGRPCVILLGKRVAQAFGLANSQWFTPLDLKLPDQANAIAIVAPHPSGANRWWNDPANQKLAKRFWTQVRKQANLPDLPTTDRRRNRPVQQPTAVVPEPGDIGDGTDLTTLPEGVKSAFEPLLPIERRFIIAYCGPARGNAQLAGKMAGISVMQVKAKDKERAAAEIARYVYTWTHAPKMRKAIEAWMEAHALGAIELTHQLGDASRANAGVFLQRNKNGTITIKPSSDFDWEAHKHWIKSAETDKDGRVTRLEVIDPMQARREIAKILKLYSDQPILALNLFLQSMSDADLLAKLNQLKALQASAERSATSGQSTTDAELVEDDDDALAYDPEPEEGDQ